MSLLAVCTFLGAAGITAAVDAGTFASGARISVIAGKPHELAFSISPSRITSPSAVFEVTNKGKRSHSFKICANPGSNDRPNSCAGTATPMLRAGRSARLTARFSTSGRYEYLSGVPSQAAAGMKGLITVTLPGGGGHGSGSSGGTVTGSQTGTTPSSSGTGPSGGVVNGQAADPACPPGTLIPAGPGAGDQDDDNEGGFPTDGDGCL